MFLRIINSKHPELAVKLIQQIADNLNFKGFGFLHATQRAVARALIGRVYIHIFVFMPDEFRLKSVVIRVNLKKCQSGITGIYEYTSTN